MKKLSGLLLVRAVKLLNVFLISGAFASAWYGYYATILADPFYRRGHWVVIAFFTVTYVLFTRIYEAFSISVSRITDMIYSQFLSFLFADAFLFMIIWLLNKIFPSVVPMLIVVAEQIVISVLWSLLSHIWYFRTHEPKSSIVVYDEREGLADLISEYGLEKKFRVTRVIDIRECVYDLSVLDKSEVVFLSDIHSHERNYILKYCVKHDKTLYVIPRLGDIVMSGARRIHLFHLPMLRTGKMDVKPEYAILKRVGDILFSIAALLIASPVMLATVIAIKLYDGGSVIYRQTRLTRGGRPFELYKFRSMVENAESDGIARLSTGKDDERVTPVGKLIRKLRIDELPQLVNVLKGDMTLVGPRPERPEIFRMYEEEVPDFSMRLQVKAGMTGYAQVYGKYNTTPYHKLQMDLMYISNANIFEDLRILIATVKILFKEESTEGVGVGHLTADAESELGGSITSSRQEEHV